MLWPFDSFTVPLVPLRLNHRMTQTASNPAAPAIRFRAVTKRFGTAVSLDGVDFDVPSGSLFGLVGANGAGKTTLLRCLLDATRPDAGEILVLDVRSTLSSARRSVAYLPERFNAPFYATGADYLSLMARLYGHSLDAEAIATALASLELDRSALKKPVRAFSKGMTQKLGLAACLLSKRPILVLDEPASGLDPQARARLKAVLTERHHAGRTIFLTSHALADVDEMCSDMAILHAGTLRFAGSPAALREAENEASLEKAFLRRIEPAAAQG